MSLINPSILPIKKGDLVKIISFKLEVDGGKCPALIVYKWDQFGEYLLDGLKSSDKDRLSTEECDLRDAVDELILSAIKEVDSNADASTSLILSDTEKNCFEERFLTYSKYSFKINILPQIDDLNSMLVHEAPSWPIFEKELTLYVRLKKKSNSYTLNHATYYYNIKDVDRMKIIGSALHNMVH